LSGASAEPAVGPSRPSPLPLAALAGIAVITVGWWALALWPLPESAPGWLERTRAACFGSAATGLPDAGGWILLVGEPVGLIAVLLVVWGGGVRDGLARLARSWGGRVTLSGTAMALLVAVSAAAVRIGRAAASPPTGPAEGGGGAVALDDPAPPLALVDQHGDSVSLDRLSGRTVVVTFGFGHCETVCPALIRNALSASRRRTGARPAVLIVTLDPWRDTPARLASLAARWGLATREHVLSGSVEEVERTLNAWRVPRVRNRATGALVHPAVTYVVSSAGRMAWLTDGTSAALERALAGP
jgi:protein SCO1/2